jgi:hypothetical protein
MTPEPDYNLNQPSVSNSDGGSLQLPFALLTAAIAVVMVAQTVNVFRAHGSLRDGQAKLADAFRQREALVKKSADVQQQLQSIILDLLVLAQTDEEAKKIVAKYNIQQSNPTGAPATNPAPAPAPTEPPK